MGQLPSEIVSPLSRGASKQGLGHYLMGTPGARTATGKPYQVSEEGAHLQSAWSAPGLTMCLGSRLCQEGSKVCPASEKRCPEKPSEMWLLGWQEPSLGFQGAWASSRSGHSLGGQTSLAFQDLGLTRVFE